MILDIPDNEIKETLENPDKVDTLFQIDTKICKLYLKNFDYYYTLCITNSDSPEMQMNLKLPSKFAQEYVNDLNTLLDKFLEIVGIIGITDDNKGKKIDFSHKEKNLMLNPVTLRDTHFFGCQHEDVTYCFFGIQKSKHAKMLTECEVRK